MLIWLMVNLAFKCFSRVQQVAGFKAILATFNINIFVVIVVVNWTAIVVVVGSSCILITLFSTITIIIISSSRAGLQ